MRSPEPEVTIDPQIAEDVNRVKAIMEATDLKFNEVPDAFFPKWVRGVTKEMNAQSLIDEESHAELEGGDLYVLRKQG